MTLTAHRTAGEFLRSAEDALLREEAVYNLILGVASRLRDGRSYGEASPYFVTVSEGGELRIAAIRTPPHPLILAAPRGDVGAIGSLVSHLAESDPDLPGVNGLAPHASAFARLWERRRPVKVTLGIQLRIHELREVVPVVGVPGLLRAPEEGDRDLLASWICGFQAEAVPGDPPTDPHEILDRFFAGGTTLRIWDDAGPVSMAGSSRSSVHGATVSLVYTPPAHRGRGYASACVAGLSQLLLEEGYAFCTLYTDLANSTSNKIYGQIGYRAIGDAAVYRFLTP